ncbi:MAG TPA: hypothetical protein VJ785_09570 [Anaerolineales bacterium]|nr:hypothetical protein [Anaerolineales bacterium]
MKKIVILVLLVCTLLTPACVYIVLPEGLEETGGTGVGVEPGKWSGMVTNVDSSETGDLHVDLAIRNDTGDWSTMRAIEGTPAVLTTADGETSNCDTVFVGTGGHRLAPGFQMQGYTVEESDEVKTQPLYVECKGATASDGSRLTIDFESFEGILDDYDPQANRTEGTLELELDQVVTDLTYPVGTPVEGLTQEPGLSITGLSENVVTLLDTQRTDTGFQFTWQNFNPTKFPLKTHIGTPPVIGEDGIIYGVYESLDIAEIPITPANETTEWTTEVLTPQDVKGFYILLSVESKKPRTYLNYALDITEK